jgi:hypothetical protein
MDNQGTKLIQTISEHETRNIKDLIKSQEVLTILSMWMTKQSQHVYILCVKNCMN